jgi:hypothetical protein
MPSLTSSLTAGAQFLGCIPPRFVVLSNLNGFQALTMRADYAAFCTCERRIFVHRHQLVLQLHCGGDDTVPPGKFGMATLPNARILLCL